MPITADEMAILNSDQSQLEFSKMPKAIQLTYKGSALVITGVLIMDWLVDRFRQLNITPPNDNKVFRELGANPLSWLAEALPLESSYDLPISVKDSKQSMIELITFMESNYKLKNFEEFISWQKALTNQNINQLNKKHNSYKVKKSIEEEKQFLDTLDNYEKGRRLYSTYLKKIIRHVIEDGYVIPEAPTEFRLYHIGGDVIAIATPSRRYADSIGPYAYWEAQRQQVESTAAVRLHTDSSTMSSEKSESEINAFNSGIARSLSDIQVKNAAKLVDRILNIEIRANNRLRYTREQLRQLIPTEEYAKSIENIKGPPYAQLYIHLEKYWNKYGDITVVHHLRDFLTSNSAAPNNTSLSILAGSWFLSEVSRNPTCLLSLILLDFIEGKITFPTSEGMKRFTWANVLWDSRTAYLSRVDAEEQFPNSWGGLHPMCHSQSFLESFSANCWDKNFTSVARRKEAFIILNWLRRIIHSSCEPQLIFELKSSMFKTDESKERAFLNEVIWPFIKLRLKTFDYIPVDNASYELCSHKTIQNSLSFQTNNNNISSTAQTANTHVNLRTKKDNIERIPLYTNLSFTNMGSNKTTQQNVEGNLLDVLFEKCTSLIPAHIKTKIKSADELKVSTIKYMRRCSSSNDSWIKKFFPYEEKLTPYIHRINKATKVQLEDILLFAQAICHLFNENLYITWLNETKTSKIYNIDGSGYKVELQQPPENVTHIDFTKINVEPNKGITNSN